MRIKIAEIIALGALVLTVFKAMKLSKKWYLGLLCGVLVACLIAGFFPSDETVKNIDSHNQEVKTSGDNSPAIVATMASGSNSTQTQNISTAPVYNLKDSLLIAGGTNTITQNNYAAPPPEAIDTKKDIRELLFGINPEIISQIDAGNDLVFVMIGEYGRMKLADLSHRKDFVDFLQFKVTSNTIMGGSGNSIGGFMNDSSGGTLVSVILAPKPALKK